METKILDLPKKDHIKLKNREEWGLTRKLRQNLWQKLYQDLKNNPL